MRWIVRILYIVLFVALVFVAISFLSANAQPHQLAFLEWQLFQSTVGALILISFVLGALIGMIAGLPVILGLRRQTRKMQKKIAASQPPEADS